jgi:hypothetical protein
MKSVYVLAIAAFLTLGFGAVTAFSDGNDASD